MRFLIGLALSLSMSATSLFGAAVDGLKIHSTTTGQGPKTVILVHGWTCDESTWTEQVPALAKQYRVVTLDLPGHGKSDAPKDGKFSMDLFARAIEAVRAEVNADRVVIAGHSMGSPVVIKYAQLYPQHTIALVLVDGLMPAVSYGAPNGAALPKRSMAMAGPNGPKNREAMIGGFFSVSTTPAMRKKILDMMLAAPEATAVGAMDATDDPVTAADWKLTIPALGIYASGRPMASNAALQAHFPNSEYTQIPDTGHFLMIEKPEEFNRILIAFLAKQKY